MILKNIEIVHPISKYNTFAEICCIDNSSDNKHWQRSYLFLNEKMNVVAHFISQDCLWVEHLSKNANNLFVLSNIEKKTCEIVQVSQYNKYSSINIYDDIELGAEDSTFAVKKAGLWGFIDENGNEIIPCKYQSYCCFSQGLAAVKENGKWGFINKKGETIISFEYDIPQFSSFNGDFAPVFKEDKAGYIDKHGNEAISFKYDDVLVCYKGSRIFPVKLRGKWGFIDKDEYVVIPFIYDSVECNGDDYSLYHVVKNGKTGLVDPIKSCEIIPTIYDELCVNDGLIVVKTKTDDKKTFQIIDWNNKLISKERYDYISEYNSEGLFVASNNKKYGYINEKGEVVISFKYRKCKDFVGGIAVATNFDGTKEVIDKNGTVLYKTRPFQEIFNVGNGYIFAQNEQGYELLMPSERKY